MNFKEWIKKLMKILSVNKEYFMFVSQLLHKHYCKIEYSIPIHNVDILKIKMNKCQILYFLLQHAA